MAAFPELPQPRDSIPPKLVASDGMLAVMSLAVAGIAAGLYPARKRCLAATRGGAAQGIAMHSDLLKQAYAAMRHDMRKTLLTMLGMAWGIATVVLLLAYGNGFGNAIETSFRVSARPQSDISRTHFPTGGWQQSWSADALYQRRHRTATECRSADATHRPHGADGSRPFRTTTRSFTFTVMGLDPSIQAIWNLEVAEGRFLNDADNMQHALYAVLASEAKDKLFSGMPALGETIRINGVSV